MAAAITATKRRDMGYGHGYGNGGRPAGRPDGGRPDGGRPDGGGGSTQQAPQARAQPPRARLFSTIIIATVTANAVPGWAASTIPAATRPAERRGLPDPLRRFAGRGDRIGFSSPPPGTFDGLHRAKAKFALNSAPRVRPDRRWRRLHRQPHRQGRGRGGLKPVVFDNLVYGHGWAVKWGPLVRGDLADRRCWIDTMKRHASTPSSTSPPTPTSASRSTNPRKYFRNNVADTLNLLDAMLRRGRPRHRLLVDLRDLRRAAAGADPRGPSAEAGQPVRRDQAGGREDAALVRSAPTGCATRRCATSTPPAPIPTARSARITTRDAPDPAGDRGGAGRRPHAGRLRHRLPDARRHRRPRLHPRRDLAEAHVLALASCARARPACV